MLHRNDTDAPCSGDHVAPNPSDVQHAATTHLQRFQGRTGRTVCDGASVEEIRRRRLNQPALRGLHHDGRASRRRMGVGVNVKIRSPTFVGPKGRRQCLSTPLWRRLEPGEGEHRSESFGCPGPLAADGVGNEA